MKLKILLALIALLSLSLLAYRWHVWRNEMVTVTSAAFYDGDSGWRLDQPVRVKAGGTIWIAFPHADGIQATKHTFPEGASNVTIRAKRKDVR